MKRAKELRRDARTALKGRWASAVGTAFLASLLGGDLIQNYGGGGGSSSSSSSSNGGLVQVDPNTGSAYVQSGGQTFEIQPQVLLTILFVILAIAGIALLLRLLVGSAVEVGNARYNARLIDGEKPTVGTLFTGFKQYGAAIGSVVLRAVYTFLWTLLFIIPGIMKSYSYAMTSFVLADNPGMTANQAITRSKEIMKGRRWKLFCLELSFIGWAMLAVLTLGIGMLWLNPYQNAARAAFYRELTGPVVAPAEEVAA